MWSTSIDLYCERLAPSFWAEPVNALTNVAFFVAAWAAFRLWRRDGRGDLAILALILVVVAVGLGSFAFHTLATRGAMLLDVVPIGIFIYGYVLLALRRYLTLSWPLALGLLAAFIALSLGLAVAVPRTVLDGSTGYFPALAVLFALGLWQRERVQGRALLLAGVLFAASIALRIADLPLCGAFPLGTHFLWHILNAAVIYAVLYGAIAERQGRFVEPTAVC
jgi:Ceramidase